MKTLPARLLRCTPMVLGILFALFLSIFALDVFGVGYSLWETVVALFMHLIPVFILLIGVAFAWRWEWVGAAIFYGFCIWYIITMGSGNSFFIYLMIVGPPYLTASLFLVNWLNRTQLHAST